MKQLSTGRTIAGQAVLVGTQRRGLNWRESLNTRDECLSSLRKARNAKGGTHLRRRLCRWESRALTLGRNARTVTRPGALRAERFASAVSSFEGIAGAFFAPSMNAGARKSGGSWALRRRLQLPIRSGHHSTPRRSQLTNAASDKFTTNLVQKRKRLQPGSAQAKRLTITDQRCARPT